MNFGSFPPAHKKMFWFKKKKKNMQAHNNKRKLFPPPLPSGFREREIVRLFFFSFFKNKIDFISFPRTADRVCLSSHQIPTIKEKEKLPHFLPAPPPPFLSSPYPPENSPLFPTQKTNPERDVLPRFLLQIEQELAVPFRSPAPTHRHCLGGLFRFRHCHGGLLRFRHALAGRNRIDDEGRLARGHEQPTMHRHWRLRLNEGRRWRRFRRGSRHRLERGGRGRVEGRGQGVVVGWEVVEVRVASAGNLGRGEGRDVGDGEDLHGLRSVMQGLRGRDGLAMRDGEAGWGVALLRGGAGSAENLGSGRGWLLVVGWSDAGGRDNDSGSRSRNRPSGEDEGLRRLSGSGERFQGLMRLGGPSVLSSPELIRRRGTSNPAILGGVDIPVPLRDRPNTDRVQRWLVGHLVLIQAALLGIIAFSPADPMRTVYFFAKSARCAGIRMNNNRPCRCLFVGIYDGIYGSLFCKSVDGIDRQTPRHQLTWVSSILLTSCRHCSTPLAAEPAIPL